MSSATIADAGRFATCRRGALTREEIDQILSHRSRSRPTPWQALAGMFGRPVESIKQVVDGASFTPVESDEPAYRHYRPWTNHEQRLLALLYLEQGKPVRECADIIGRTEEAITRQLTRLGLFRKAAA